MILPEDTIKNMKGQITKQEKIFINQIPAKGIESKIYNEFLQLNNKKTIQLKYRHRNWRDIFPKKTVSEKCSKSLVISSVQFSRLCPTLCDPMNRSTPGLPVHHQLPESTQTHVHRVDDAIQPSHPLSSPSPPALNLSQHQGLFQWVSSLHQVAKVLEFQLQHQGDANWTTMEYPLYTC